ncbi:DUF1638 domain-containing protein [uncultured Serinicoccus sp.]|uniref:DUF1638 domain-containing protein n=1 Tax=uncultured Serinicoccus sp. TaxID=735514 RepID=UPI00262AECCC|nr:DUF1638 domain-containing protein [uncultured Serinicoccus sp.]
MALVACGALATHAAAAAARHTPPLPVDVHPLPPLLHNHPERIAGEVEAVVDRLAGRYDRVAVGYADCGTYGALDALCARRGVARLPGLHCYDLYAGEARVAALLEEEPGTYLLTDFLVRSFDRTVWAELGLDRYPGLRDDYFGHYTRCVWLAQEPDDPELTALAARAAGRLGLALQVERTGTAGLDDAIARLVLGP